MFAASLPDLDSLDLEAAKALLIAQHQSYTTTLSSRSTEIERLMLLVEKLQRMLFGTKSEKVLRQIEQLELQLEELQAANAIEKHAAAASVARPLAAGPSADHCPNICHVRSIPICRTMRPARIVAADYASWAKMSPRCWNTCGPASR
jgi:transposase